MTCLLRLKPLSHQREPSNGRRFSRTRSEAKRVGWKRVLCRTLLERLLDFNGNYRGGIPCL